MSETKKLIIGVLAIQGSFNEHKIALLKCLKENDAFQNVDLNVIKVTEASHLGELDGLILPGGESTSIGHIMDQDMVQKLCEWSKNDSHYLFGTCAGLIMLSKNLEGQGSQSSNQMKVRDVRFLALHIILGTGTSNGYIH